MPTGGPLFSFFFLPREGEQDRVRKSRILAVFHLHSPTGTEGSSMNPPGPSNPLALETETTIFAEAFRRDHLLSPVFTAETESRAWLREGKFNTALGFAAVDAGYPGVGTADNQPVFAPRKDGGPGRPHLVWSRPRQPSSMQSFP